MTQTSPDYAVQIKGLVKTYAASGKAPEKRALKGIDLNIPKGSMFALLGPNGAGKSTMINIMAGLVKKTAGEMKIWGADLIDQERQARANIGIVPQDLVLDPFFTPREVLELQAGLYGVPKSERDTMGLLKAVGLDDKADAYARTLSGGMRRRLMVAKAMVHRPPVLVLDEPTAGVDIELRQSLWAYVRDLNKAGTTVLLTTHYLEEAQELCDQIAIINHGRVVANESKQDLLKRLDNKSLTVELAQDIDALPETLKAHGFEQKDSRHISLSYRPSQGHMGELLAAIQAENLLIRDVSTDEADLEDIFLQLTSQKEDELEAEIATR